MTVEGANDVLERRYMGKFQAKAAEYGVIVRYERDRAARDIGIHFFRKKRSGDEEATGSLVWFQMKGLRSTTMTREDFEKSTSVSVKIEVEDLCLWYRANGPTYLVVYVESVDVFLVLNVVAFIAERFGADIFSLDQKTVNIPVSTKSILDDQAFELMIRQGAAEEWARILRFDAQDVRLAQRDYRLIWRLGTAQTRSVEYRVDVKDWQSKLRGEVQFLESATHESDREWIPVRDHWQHRLRIEDIEKAYPYLSFEAFDEERQGNIEFFSNEDDEPAAELSDGTVIYGHYCAGEYNLYKLRPRLNAAGERLMEMIETLVRAGMIEAPNENDPREMLDVAPWHSRDV